MCDKFTTELVWHNCKTNPPKEFENDFLIGTDGVNVYGMSWHRAEGYHIAVDDFYLLLNPVCLDYWWWADVEQTVRSEERFNKDR